MATEGQHCLTNVVAIMVNSRVWYCEIPFNKTKIFFFSNPFWLTRLEVFSKGGASILPAGFHLQWHRYCLILWIPPPPDTDGHSICRLRGGDALPATSIVIVIQEPHLSAAGARSNLSSSTVAQVTWITSVAIPTRTSPITTSQICFPDTSHNKPGRNRTGKHFRYNARHAPKMIHSSITIISFHYTGVFCSADVTKALFQGPFSVNTLTIIGSLVTLKILYHSHRTLAKWLQVEASGLVLHSVRDDVDSLLPEYLVYPSGVGGVGSVPQFLGDLGGAGPCWDKPQTLGEKQACLPFSCTQQHKRVNTH